MSTWAIVWSKMKIFTHFRANVHWQISLEQLSLNRDSETPRLGKLGKIELKMRLFIPLLTKFIFFVKNFWLLYLQNNNDVKLTWTFSVYILNVDKTRQEKPAKERYCSNAVFYSSGFFFKCLTYPMPICSHPCSQPVHFYLLLAPYFCEMEVNFYAVLSKRGRFCKAPSLKTSCFPCRGPRVSTFGGLFGLFCFEFVFGEVNRPIYCGTQYILSLEKSK